MNIKYIPYSIISTIVLLVILSFAVTDTLLPWGILIKPALGWKIFGWFLMVQMVLAFMYWIVMNKVVPDKECPICLRDLKAFIPVYGQLTICPKCRTLFHQHCWISKGKRCPICHPDAPGEINIPHDFTSDFFHSKYDKDT